MIGQPILRLIPADRLHEEDEVLRRIRKGERVDHFETIRRRKDGALLPISLTVSPIRDESGTIVGASKIARDTSDRHRAEAMLARLDADRSDLQRRLLTLVSASQRVVGRPESGDVLSATMELARELISADAYMLWRMIGPNEWAAVRSVGVSAAFADLGMPQVNGKPLPPPVGPLVVDDVTALPELADRFEAYRHEGIVSLLVIPLRIGDDVSGTLVFYYRTPHTFSDVEVQTATALGNLAAAGIASAELHEQESAAREEARQANRVKDQFLATLSHELRTPINAILGYARMLVRRPMTPEQQENALRVVERNATALAQIVEDVLDVSRIVSGKLAIRTEEVDLVPLVQHAVEAVVPMAQEKQVRVTTEVAVVRALVRGDASRLQQVLWNLLSNALKFTPAAGAVTVVLTADEQTARIQVQDTGIGIAADFLETIFEPFRQADSRETRERGGLGLGLAIIRRLVELHGGTIIATSDGEGTGTTFEVTLPLAADPGADPATTVTETD